MSQNKLEYNSKPDPDSFPEGALRLDSLPGNSSDTLTRHYCFLSMTVLLFLLEWHHR